MLNRRLANFNQNQIIWIFPQRYQFQSYMSGLKNLTKRSIFVEGNFSILKKKAEGFKRNINGFVEHLQQISKIYQNYYSTFEENLRELQTALPGEQQISLKAIREIVVLQQQLNRELQKFIERQSSNQKPILQLSELFMTDYNILVERFHQSCKQYGLKQANLVESTEQYWRLYKQMQSSVESYKNTFMDVKMIYNKEEKIRKYNECLYTYKNLEEDLAIITKKIQELNKQRQGLGDSYLILQRQLVNFTSSFASKYIDGLKSFSQGFYSLQESMLALLSNKIHNIQQTPIQSFLSSSLNNRYSKFIDIPIQQNHSFLPTFIELNDNLSDQGRQKFKKMLVIYYLETSVRAEKRKIINKKIIEYLYKYLKALDKNLMEGYRQTIQNFEKMRKKIGEVFGNRWISFYKIVSSILQNSIQNTGRLIKRAEAKIKGIQANSFEHTTIFDNFLNSFRLYIEKSISKKIFKKYSGGQQKSDIMLQEQLNTTRQQIKQISLVVANQITKIYESLNKLQLSNRTLYTSFLLDLKNSVVELQGFCGQIAENYYGEQIYMRNYKLCQQQIAGSVKKQMKFFDDLQFSTLKQSAKITFDGQFHKIEGFKKIKKPKQLQESRGQIPGVNSLSLRGTQQAQNNASSSEFIGQMSKQIQKEIFIGQSTSKYAEFLSKKIDFLQNQKFIKSCSCALLDKIILSGRMFITSHRLFFYSKFNSSNIFFGDTFMSVPKEDIKKVQKKSSGIILTNSITITTVNGELNFTSFLTRDKIFDILKAAYQINNQELFFEEQQGQGNNQIQQQKQFEDDMKEETRKTRQITLSQKFSKFQYFQVFSGQFQLFGLTPIKFLKLFELDQQININRMSFSSFTYYLKDLALHKDINIQPWSPNPMEYLNIVNIKEITPQLFTRKISAIVPLPNSGIPFMPKTSLTTQEQTLYIINKDKYIIQIIVKSFGVPYCDAFDIRIRKTVERNGDNKLKMIVEAFVNFNQNVMVKSTIQSKSTEGSKENYEIQATQIRKYLKVLQKKLMKGQKKESPQEKLLEQAQLIQQLEKQLQQAKKAKRIDDQIIMKQKNLNKNLKIGLIVLAILCLMELIMLFY